MYSQEPWSVNNTEVSGSPFTVDTLPVGKGKGCNQPATDESIQVLGELLGVYVCLLPTTWVSKGESESPSGFLMCKSDWALW